MKKTRFKLHAKNKIRIKWKKQDLNYMQKIRFESNEKIRFKWNEKTRFESDETIRFEFREKK